MTLSDRPRRPALLPLAGVLVALVAPAFAQDTMPPIHVESLIERLHGGENVVQRGYRNMLASCDAAGLPTSPLSDEAAALIGTTRVQRWIAQDEFALREESWSFHIAGEGRDQMCQFSLGYEGREAFADRNAYRERDLVTDETHAMAVDNADLFDRSPVGEGSGARGDRAAMACGPHPQLPYEICMWDGGQDWGFLSAPSLFDASSTRQMNTRIVLSQEPVGGSGERVRTLAFTIGEPFDMEALRP